MSMLRELPLRLQQRGVTVRLLPDWQELQHIGDWADSEPYAHMWHHTASAAYTPNREKANAWAGLSIDGSKRLYQEDYDGEAEAVYVFGNLYPAPVSSGAGDVGVLEAIQRGEEIVGRQGPDTPDWYGNRFYWNTEVVLDGIGTVIDDKVWAMMIIVAQEQNELMGWDRVNHIAHAHHTRRKIDLYDGRDSDFDETLLRLRNDIEQETAMELERYATRWRNPEDFDAAVVKGLITEAEAAYWKTVATDSAEWADLRDAVAVRKDLW